MQWKGPNLFIEPEHGARHRDVRKADPLTHEESAGVQVLVQDGQDLLYIFFGLLCGLHGEKKSV